MFFSIALVLIILAVFRARIKVLCFLLNGRRLQNSQQFWHRLSSSLNIELESYFSSGLNGEVYLGKKESKLFIFMDEKLCLSHDQLRLTCLKLKKLSIAKYWLMSFLLIINSMAFGAYRLFFVLIMNKEQQRFLFIIQDKAYEFLQSIFWGKAEASEGSIKVRII